MVKVQPNLDEPYTRAEYLILFSCIVLSTTLSATGSTLIVKHILQRRQTKLIYHRLVLGLSTADIGLSLCYGCHLFLTPNLPWLGNFLAVGTVRSCQVSTAVWTMFLLAMPIYNASIAFYFYMTVCLQWREEKIVRCLEIPALCITVLVCFFTTGILAWLVRDEDPSRFLLYCSFGGGEISSTVLLVSFITIPPIAAMRVTYLVWSKVNKQFEQSRRFTFQSVQMGTIGTETDAMDNDNATNAPHPLARQTAIQAVLYCAAFMNSIIWVLAASGGETTPYPIFVLFCLFQPLQGFLNCFIYFRPTVARLLAAQEEQEENGTTDSPSRIWIKVVLGGGGSGSTTEGCRTAGELSHAGVSHTLNTPESNNAELLNL